MKRLLLPVILLTLTMSCDSPQRTRSNMIGTSGLNSPTNATDFGGTGTNPPTGTTGGSTTGTSGTTTADPGFEACDISDKYHTIDIGHFGLCQSTQDETQFKFRTSLASPTARICLIPTYKDATGSSTYIGQPQCTYTEANKVVKGKLYKNRTGFENYTLNGVIVLKEALMTPYFNCMNAYVNWPAQACPQGPNSSQYCYSWIGACPYGPQSSMSCDTQAKSYMAQVCNSFKSTYSNSYADIRTK